MKAPRQDIYNAVIHRMVLEALNAKHDAFALEHGQDTDEQLIAYIRSCARQLGHPPHQKEIIGWPMITARFGTWGDALRAAKLPLPRTPNTPSQFAITLEETEAQKSIYREKSDRKSFRHSSVWRSRSVEKRSMLLVLKRSRKQFLLKNHNHT